MKNENFDCEDILPLTAVAIKVTNILTPYIIRICEINDYKKKLNFINTKLLLTKRKMFNINTKDIEPEIGHTIIACDNLHKDINLPSSLCRGNISNTINSVKDTYNILLVDYGISVELQREDLVMCRTDLISEEYLSFTVGLYNVLPIAINCNSSIQDKTSVIVLEEWSTSAIHYTKELVTASNAIYFDHIVSDECGRYYGEFYLNIEDTIINLSKALVLNNYAIYLQGELLTFIKNHKSCEKSRKKIINGKTIFYVNISNDYKTNNASCKKQKRGLKKIYKKGKEMENVLIYGRAIYECLNTISDLRFPAKIHKAWNSLIQSSTPKRIQSYIWPAIKKGFDVIAIGIEKSGKTLGYVFAICGLLATNLNLSQGMNNPLALILCSSSSEVLGVHALCTTILQSYTNIRSVAVINDKSERSLVAEILNGCQILVSTPRFLSRFMDRNNKFLNFQNLQYLILDNGDIILDKYFDSISKLFGKYEIIYNKKNKSTRTLLQIIVTAKHWTQRLKKIACIFMDNPYICVASFIEAAIFKSIHPKMYIMNSKSKNEKILDLLSDKYSKSRTVIVCIDCDEAKELHKFLKQHKDTLIAHENMDIIHLQGIKQYWDACVNGFYPVLICTDEVLSDLHITTASWLIHYSVSLRFKTQFNFRFSTLLENLQMENSNCKVTIMINENNDIQFLSIIKIMQRMNVVISQNMLKNIERIKASLEMDKENQSFCINMKLWGLCHTSHSCTFRHRIIPKFDAPIMNIRINDKVKFRILNIHNVTHISARILSYIKFDTLEEVEFSNIEYLEIYMKIQNFYSRIGNRRTSEVIDVGSIHGLEEPIDSFKRVQILCIEREMKTDMPKFVDVKCIDDGVIFKKVNTYRLLHMPEEFVKYPTHVIEVFLVGIVPHDDEYIWNHFAVDTVHQWFRENNDERSYVIGTVNLHLKNTIWVDTLEFGTKLIGYKDLISSSLKAELLGKNHAIENDEHLSRLHQLCKEAGL